MTMLLFTALLLGAAPAPTAPSPAPPQRYPNTEAMPQPPILAGVVVPAGNDIFFVSGQPAAPLDTSKPATPALTAADYGDTRTQTISALAKIETILTSHGYAMSDVVKLTVFIVADPKTGKMDFAGMASAFGTFFGTAGNPHTVARSTVQVAALAQQGFLVEIEATAAKPHR